MSKKPKPLTVGEKKAIKGMAHFGVPQKVIAHKFKKSPSTISRVVNPKSRGNA